MISSRNRLQIAMLVSAVLHAALAWATLSSRSHARTETATTAQRSSSRVEGRAPLRVRLIALDSLAIASDASLRVEQPAAPSTRARMRGATRPGSPFNPSAERHQASILSHNPDSAGPPVPPEPLQPSTFNSSTSSSNAAAIGSAGGRDDAAWLADLHRRLNAAAQKCYPPRARRLRLRGEMSVLFALNEQGEASRVQLARSSGSAILDEAATECVLRGALPAPGRPGEYGPVTIKFAEQP